MALDGAAWAGVFADVAEYLRGDAVLYLTPVAGGGPVPFNHDGIERAPDVDGNVTHVIVTLKVVTGVALALNGLYTFDSQTWQVVTHKGHDVADGKGQRHYELVQHAQ